jgi:uncharacterized protein YbjT (DUF2867 family)
MEPVRFDWTDESTYEAARQGVDAMYLVAGPFPGPEHADYIRALLDSATGAGVKRVVLLSVYGVDQAPPENPLRRVELAVESSGVPYTILRPGAFMQNFSEGHFIRAVASIRERDEIAMPGGNGVVSWVSTEDIAAVAAIALTEDGHDGRAYVQLGPEPLTLTQVAEHISWVAGRRIRYVETDHKPLRDELVAAGAPPETAEDNSQLAAFAFSRRSPDPQFGQTSLKPAKNSASFPSKRNHSERSTRIGSSEAARRAGTRLASNPTSRMPRATTR